jgi:hypothetical protein
MDRWAAAHGGGAVLAEGGNEVRDGQAGADDRPPDFRFKPFQEAMDHDADDELGQEAAVNVDEPQVAGDPPDDEIRDDDGMDEDETV